MTAFGEVRGGRSTSRPVRIGPARLRSTGAHEEIAKPMSYAALSRTIRPGTTAALLALGLMVAPVTGQAQAASMRDVLKRACMGDYFAYCGDHEPGGAAVEACFRRNMRKLSPPCAQAISAFKREKKTKRVSDAY